MNPDHVELRERSKSHTSCDSIEMSRLVEPLEMDSRFVVARAGEGGNRERLLVGMGFLLGVMNVLELDGGGGARQCGCIKNHWTGRCEMVQMVDFMLRECYLIHT